MIPMVDNNLLVYCILESTSRHEFNVQVVFCPNSHVVVLLLLSS